MIRLAIAAPHELVRWGLGAALAAVPDLELVGDAGTAADALAMIHRARPEVVLLDARLPDHSRYDVLRDIAELDAGPLVIVLGADDEPAVAASAIGMGAHGFVPWSARPDALLDAIRAVFRGERAVPPAVDALVAAGDGHPASALTKRELQVMEMIARGMTNREIAEDLEISVKTIDTHRGHILKKLALRNNSELTRFAVKHGYVTV